MGFGVQTQTIVTSTTSVQQELPPRTVMILLRGATANTTNIHVGIGLFTSTTGNLIIRPDESVAIDFSSAILLARELQGGVTEEQDFPRVLSIRAASGTPTLYVDAFPVPA